MAARSGRRRATALRAPCGSRLPPPMPIRATKRGAERTAARAATTTSLICGASFAGLDRRARAGRLRRAACWCSTATRSASARPPPARRPTEWLEALGLEDVDPADVRRAGRPHPARTRRAAAALDVLDLRLPRAVPAALGAVRRRVRDREGRTAAPTADGDDDRRRHRPRRRLGAARRRRARLAAGPRPPTRLPAAGRAALARARGPSRRRRRRPRDLDRPPLRARRLRLRNTIRLGKSCRVLLINDTRRIPFKKSPA